MKKLNVLVLAIFGLLVFATSCNSETGDKASPSVTFTQGDQTVAPSTSVVITGKVSAPGKLKVIEFYKSDKLYGESITKKFDTDTTHAFSVTIPADQVTETFEFEVVVTDKEEQKGKKRATITVTTDPGGPTYTVQTLSGLQLKFNNSNESECQNVVSMGGILNGFSGNGTAFECVFVWNSQTGPCYGSPDAKLVKNLMEANPGHTYAGSTNHTSFMAISASEYDNATVDYINGLNVTDNLTLGSNQGSGVKNATVGSTYATKNHNGIVSLFKVVSQNTKDRASASATIEIKYVMQSSAK